MGIYWVDLLCLVVRQLNRMVRCRTSQILGIIHLLVTRLTYARIKLTIVLRKTRQTLSVSSVSHSANRMRGGFQPWKLSGLLYMLTRPYRHSQDIQRPSGPMQGTKCLLDIFSAVVDGKRTFTVIKLYLHASGT